MLLIYFKQAWTLLKQEKLFSSIYLIGTALSITMVMVLAIVLYIRMANIYPETNRDRMLVVKSASVYDEKSDRTSSAGLSMRTIRACFSELKSAETLSIVSESFGEDFFVQLSSNKQQPVTVQFVDQNYWRVFPFLFRDGRPFTAADVESAIRTAVISESMAQKAFGTIEAEGKYISLNFKQYRVAGVVKDPSYALPDTYAQLWIPYTLSEFFSVDWEETQAMGSNKVYILAPSIQELDVIKKEIEVNVHKYSTTFPEGKNFSLNGQPDTHWQSVHRFFSNDNPDFTKLIIQYILLLFIFLLVPAVSLSGMIDSRMERRLAECGVRRAFGAPNLTLMKQIIWENLLFTLFGGGLGLLFSYLVIYVGRSRILELGQRLVEIPVEGTEIVFTPGMLINFPVFIVALFLCLLLNVFSAAIPAWKASRRQIVYSLSSKQ